MITFHKHVAFIAAVVGAAIIGGVSTAVVTAAIPSSADGKIYACYRDGNDKGTLRVIDTQAGQNCTTQESPLNWDQSGQSTSQDKTVGNQMELAWGSIPQNGTPVKFLTVPGFGDFNITRCDNDGILETTFTNTSGVPLRMGNDVDPITIQPGQTISSASTVPNYFAVGTLGKGSGSSTQVVSQLMNQSVSVESRTCRLHNVAIIAGPTSN